MDSFAGRKASLSLMGCLWTALAAWLWLGAAAPLDGLTRLAAAAHGDDGHALVSADRGHAHDPARQPSTGMAESESSEEELGDDGEVDHDVGPLALHAARLRVSQSCVTQSACPRDPSVAQRHNRGPPRA